MKMIALGAAAMAAVAQSAAACGDYILRNCGLA